MESETLQKVIQLIAEQTGVSVSHITASTRLAEDLGVDGDDASELLTKFASRFQVDLTDFDFSRHFGPEASWSPIAALSRLFTNRSQTYPITVKDMVMAAMKGVWKYEP